MSPLTATFVRSGTPLVGQQRLEGTMVASDDFLSTTRLEIAAFCVMFPLVLFAVGILGAYWIHGRDKMWEFSTKNYNVVFGVPMSVIASLAVIVILVTTTPKDTFSIKIFDVFEMTGPSVPIVLWMGCFLVIMFGIYIMSGKIQNAKEGKTDLHRAVSRPVVQSE
jgi:hypothetical protein